MGIPKEFKSKSKEELSTLAVPKLPTRCSASTASTFSSDSKLKEPKGFGMRPGSRSNGTFLSGSSMSLPNTDSAMVLNRASMSMSTSNVSIGVVGLLVGRCVFLVFLDFLDFGCGVGSPVGRVVGSDVGRADGRRVGMPVGRRVGN